MAAGAAGAAPMECPDPSAHGRDQRLQDQASKAALYVTHPEQATDVRSSIPALGPDGKLSSAGAAASLKHAQPHELPAFPSVGIDKSSSGHTAANLAHANQKPFEHWKPDLSSHAGKAALLAHKDGGKLDLWQPSASSDGHSAAGIAMGKQSGLSPQLDYGYTDEGKKKALLAATLSVAGRARPPPQPEQAPSYPDAENASANALNAAAVAHRPSAAARDEPIRVSSPANEAARITHIGSNVNREAFGYNPKLDLPGEELVKQQQALRGATLSVQRDSAARAKEIEVEGPLMGSDPQTVSRNYMHLQEAAHKLAQERLSKLDPDGVQAYRDHYGYGSSSPPRGKLSVRNRRSRGSSNEANEPDDEDAAQARRIRSQMNQFTDSLADADAKKRAKDRSSVLAAAEKNVRARMSGIDQDIFDQTGKVTPQMMEQWEAKARAKAAADSDKRMENHGLIHLGGGKFMEQGDITAIAQERMQPTLDEIHDNAEKQRKRDEAIRADQEERRRIAAAEKQRKEDEKMQAKYERDVEKRHQRELKDMEKEEKRVQKEQRKQQEQEWKREQENAKTKADQGKVSKELDAGAVGATAVAAGAAETDGAEEHAEKPEELHQTLTDGEAAAANKSGEDPPGVPTDFGHKSPLSPTGEFQTDSGVDARKAENSEKLQEIGVDHNSAKLTKKEKRESRVKSFFGKFKRSSKASSSDAAEIEAEPVEKHAGSTAVTTAAVASPEEAAHDEAKKKEFHEAVASAKDEEDNDPEGLYAAPSNTAAAVHPDTTAAIAANELSAEAASKPSTVIVESSAVTVTTAPEPSSVRQSVATTSDEFEEARDKFDEDDQPDTATLKAPESTKVETSPSRPTSKFQEDL